jgi:hypothetical protein
MDFSCYSQGEPDCTTRCESWIVDSTSIVETSPKKTINPVHIRTRKSFAIILVFPILLFVRMYGSTLHSQIPHKIQSPPSPLLIYSQGRLESTRRLADLRDLRDGTERTRVRRVVPRTRERILDRRRALVDRREGGRADVELRVQVVLDLDGVARVLVCCRKYRARLSRDGYGGVEVEQLLSEHGCGGVVLRFGELHHRESEGELEMRGLEATVGEVGGELELALRRVRLVLQSATFHLEGNSNQVFSADDDELLQLWEKT